MATVLPAHAAGSVTLSVEPAGENLVTQTSTIFKFYANAVGVNLFSVGFDVSLKGLTYNSYDATGTSFNAVSGVPAGNTTGSTAFSVTASDSAPTQGSSGKRFIGSVSALSGAAGDASIIFSNLEAYDFSNNQIPITSQSANYTIVSATSKSPSNAPKPVVTGSAAPNASTDTKIAIPNDTGNGTTITNTGEIKNIASVDPNRAKSTSTILAKTPSATVAHKRSLVLPLVGIVFLLPLIAGALLVLFRKRQQRMKIGGIDGPIYPPKS